MKCPEQGCHKDLELVCTSKRGEARAYELRCMGPHSKPKVDPKIDGQTQESIARGRMAGDPRVQRGS